MNKSYFCRIALFSLFAFLIPMVVFAANDVSVTQGPKVTSVVLPSDSSEYTIDDGSGNTVNSFTVNDTSFSVSVEGGGRFELRSWDGRDFNVSGGGSCVASTDCAVDYSAIILFCGVSSSGTFTIMPQTSVCTTPRGSGGGGATVFAPPTSEPTPEPTPEPESVEDIVLPDRVEVKSEERQVAFPPTIMSLKKTGVQSIVIGLTPHEVEVLSFTETTIRIRLSSDPVELDLSVGDIRDVDTDSDGQLDTRVEFVGFDDDGEPVVHFTALEVDVSCPVDTESVYKEPGAPGVYYVTKNCTRRAFTRAATYFTYFDDWSVVESIPKTTLESVPLDPLGFMPKGPKYDPKYGALVKIVTDPKVYLLLGDEKYWINSESVFTGLSYDWSWIEDIDYRLLDKYKTGSEITYTDHHPNFTLIKYENDPKVYQLAPDPADSTKQVKRHIKNEAAFNKLNFRWDRIVLLDDSEAYTDGEILE